MKIFIAVCVFFNNLENIGTLGITFGTTLDSHTRVMLNKVEI